MNSKELLIGVLAALWLKRRRYYNRKRDRAAALRIQARRQARDYLNGEILAALARGVQPKAKAIAIDMHRSPAYISKVGTVAGWRFQSGSHGRVIQSPCQVPKSNTSPSHA